MKILKEVIRAASESYGKPFDPSSLRPVSGASNDTAVADATQAFYLKSKEERGEFVIIIANPNFPNAVAEAANKARSVVANLKPETGYHVLTPLAEGFHGGQSYAVFPRYQTLSESKILRYIQKKHVSGRVCAWLGDVGLQTREYCDPDDDRDGKFIAPFEFLIDATDMPGDIRTFAQTCRSTVLDKSVNLFTIAEHGDFWIGNILHGRSGASGLGTLFGDFFVIDWRGADMAGRPGMDIVRYCISAFAPGSGSPARHMEKYMSTLDLSGFELALYCMSSIGHLGMNLDQFPRERYLELADSVFTFLKDQKIIG